MTRQVRRWVMDDATVSTVAGLPLSGFTVSAAGGGLRRGLASAANTSLAHLRLLGATVEAVDVAGEGNDVRIRLTGPDATVVTTIGGWPASDAPTSELLAQAATGLMALHGLASGAPRVLRTDYLSTLTGIAAVQGTLAAVWAQRRGARIAAAQVSLVGTAALALGQYIAAATSQDDEPVAPAPHSGQPPPFRSADGVAFEIETLDAAPWRSFWAELGAPSDAVRTSWPPFQLRYVRSAAPLSPALHTAAAAWDFAGVLEVAGRTGMDVCPVRTLAERRADPALWPMATGGAPWSLTPVQDASTPLGHGRGGQRTGALAAPLGGLTVVESTRRVQGPTATRILQLLGGRVCRIEPPGGDPLRGMPPMAEDCSARFAALNDGKDVVELDFTTAQGREQIAALVRDADVFVHNWAPGKAEALRLDAADLQAVNPSLVYAYASGWGDVLGPKPPMGTDFMVQAYSGVADVLGPVDGACRPSLVTILDLLGGFVAAEGVLAALVLRQREAVARRVDTSLLSAATTLLASRLGATSEVPEPADRFHGVFDTAFGQLVIDVTGSGRERLKAALGLAEPLDRASVERVLRSGEAAEWVQKLQVADVPAELVRTDVGSVALDDRVTGLFSRRGCALAGSPWRFR